MYNFKDKYDIGTAVRYELQAMEDTQRENAPSAEEISTRKRRERKVMFARFCKLLSKIKNFTFNE